MCLCYKAVVGRLCLSFPSDRTGGNGLKLHQARLSLDFSKKFLHQKGCQALSQAAHGNGGVAIPSGFYKMWPLGTWIISGLGSAALMVGVCDLKWIFQLK